MKHYNLKANRRTDQFKILYLWCDQSTPVAARSKAWVCGRSPAETVGSNPTEGQGCLSWVLCIVQVEVSATGWSLVQRSDLGTSRMRRSWPAMGSQAIGEEPKLIIPTNSFVIISTDLNLRSGFAIKIVYAFLIFPYYMCYCYNPPLPSIPSKTRWTTHIVNLHTYIHIHSFI